MTRSGRESELRKIKIDTNKIYKHEPLPKGYGGDDPNFDLAIKTAQKQGYIAMWVDEGYDQPNSVFIINPNEKINEDNNIINDNRDHIEYYKTIDGNILSLFSLYVASDDNITNELYYNINYFILFMPKIKIHILLKNDL